MADFSNIYNEIDANVNANGQQKITGPVLNKTLKDMLQEVDSEKQDTLVAGQNIQINGNVISATGGGSGETYTAGRAINIDSNNRINVVPSELPFYLAGRGLSAVSNGTLAVNYDMIPSEIAGNGLQSDGNGNLEVVPSEIAGNGLQDNGNGKLAVDPSVVQEKLQAGSNITIYGNTISATDTNTTYSAGQGLELNGTTFAVKAGSGLGFDANGNLVNTGGGGGGTTYTAGSGIDIDQNDAINAKLGNGLQLDGSNNIEINPSVVATQSDLSGKQNTLQAGSNIQINGNVISATDTNTTYSAGSGLNLNGTTFSVDTTAIQEKLTAGQNITISGNVISAAGGSGSSYSAGNGIDISNNTISVDATDLTGAYLGSTNDGKLFVNAYYLADSLDGNGLNWNSQTGELDVDTSVVQEKLVAGNNIQINGNVISATGGSGSSYSAGNGIDISNNTISVDATDLDGAGLTTNQNGELVVDTNVIQGKLTAGSGISIQNNVISATGGGGGSLWTSGTGTDSLFAPGTGSDIDYVDPSDPSQGINNQSQSTGTRSIATGFFTHATGDYSAAFGDGTFASGYASAAFGQGANASGYLSFASGSWTQANGSYSAAFGESTIASNTHDFVAGYHLDTSGMQGHEAAFGQYNDTNNANGPYLFTIGDGELQEIYHEYGTPSWEPNPDDPSSTDSWWEYIEVRKNAVDIKPNGDVFIEDIGGYDGTNSSNATRLQDVISGKQDTLTAGSGITIQNNVISATGGGGSGLWTSGSGTNSVMSPGAFQANGNNSVSAGDYTRSNGTSSIALGTSTTTTGLSSVAIGANSTAAGSYSVALGHGLGAVNSDETALGKFNNYIDTGTTAEKTFFTVGNGTSNNTKSNVLEVKQNDDIYVSGIGGFDGTNASSADTLQDVIAGKQDTLVAGSNITISGNVISATGGGGGSYTASHGIDITNDAISVDVSDLNGTGLIADHQRGILEVDFTTVQGKLTAGQNITISGNVISATGGSGSSYSAGQGIDITNNTISVDNTIATVSDLGGYLPLVGGTLQEDPNNSTSTELLIQSPDNYATADLTTVDLDPGNTAESLAKLTLSDYDSSSNPHTAIYETTGISNGTYKISFPTLSGDDTFALLSDVQGGGSSYSAGAGIDITNNVISSTTLVPGTGTGSLMALNANRATGADSIAIGDGSVATGNNAVAIGYSSSALKNDSISLGGYVDGQSSFGGPATVVNTNAHYSVALGYNSQVDAEAGVALGYNSKTVKPYEYTIGKYNKTYSSNSDDTRLLFSIGNGTSSLARSNALEIKNNNDVYVYGVGGFDGTNASSATTLQDAIANAGGGGTTYTAGQAIDITNGAISVDYGSGLGLGTNGELQVEWSEGPTALAGSGLSANTQNGQLDVDFTSVQGKLTAGSGITISGNTISATGGGGGSLWSSGTGVDSLVSPGAASTQGSDAAGIGAIVIGEDSIAGGDYSFAHGQSSMADGAYSAAFVNSNSTGDYSFAAGSGADAQADYSVALGGGTVVSDDSDPNNPIDALRGVAIGEGATVNGVCGLAFMGGTATGEYSVAIGDSANANEMYSTALTGSTAAGNYSFAASTGVANAHYSTALSGGTVYGEGSLASGFENNVYGYCSAALGYKLSTYDQADGTSDTDPNAGEVALGRYNYSEQDIIFSIGCGYFDDSDPDNPQEVRENAITITNDGKIYIKGLGQYTGTQVAGCTDLVSFLNNL